MLSEIIARDVTLFLFCAKRCLWELASELGMLEKFVLGSYQLRVIRLYLRDGIPFSLWLLQVSLVTRMNE